MGNGNATEEQRRAPPARLPTPHGEREPLPRKGRRRRYRPSNPSWGTGTRQCMWRVSPLAFFQPLMGNGNGQTCAADIPTIELPTPHGERERRLEGGRSGGGGPSNPSWGTGTIEVAGFVWTAFRS